MVQRRTSLFFVSISWPPFLGSPYISWDWDSVSLPCVEGRGRCGDHRSEAYLLPAHLEETVFSAQIPGKTVFLLAHHSSSPPPTLQSIWPRIGVTSET